MNFLVTIPFSGVMLTQHHVSLQAGGVDASQGELKAPMSEVRMSN